MNSLTYTNGVLTMLAILLSLTLFTAWSGGGGAASESAYISDARADGITNAGAQRQAMLNQLQLMNTKIDAVQSAISGGVRVRVEAAGEGEAQ